MFLKSFFLFHDFVYIFNIFLLNLHYFYMLKLGSKFITRVVIPLVTLGKFTAGPPAPRYSITSIRIFEVPKYLQT